MAKYFSLSPADIEKLEAELSSEKSGSQSAVGAA